MNYKTKKIAMFKEKYMPDIKFSSSPWYQPSLDLIEEQVAFLSDTIEECRESNHNKTIDEIKGMKLEMPERLSGNPYLAEQWIRFEIIKQLKDKFEGKEDV